jgi:hypothetical protein
LLFNGNSYICPTDTFFSHFEFAPNAEAEEHKRYAELLVEAQKLKNEIDVSQAEFVEIDNLFLLGTGSESQETSIVLARKDMVADEAGKMIAGKRDALNEKISLLETIRESMRKIRRRQDALTDLLLGIGDISKKNSKGLN